MIKNCCQQPFQEMAKNVQNSHFSFARNIILVENKRLRSSPLHEAAERYRANLSRGNGIQ